MPSQPLTPAVDVETLPNDSPSLKGMIVELVQQLHEQQLHAAHLQARLDQLVRRLFGRRSERLDPGQLSLFGTEADASPASAVDASSQANADTSRRRRRGAHGRQRLPEWLPRQIHRHELTEAERTCPCCGQQRTALGEEVSEQLEYVPASLVVHQHVRVTYVCRPCEQHGQQPRVRTDSTAPARVPRESAPAESTPTGEGIQVAEQIPGSAVADDALDVPTVDTTNAATLTLAGVSLASDLVPKCDTMLPGSCPGPELPAASASAVYPVCVPMPTGEAPLVVNANVASTVVPEDVNPATPPPVGPSGQATPRSTIITAPMPAQPIPRCLAGPGLLARVIVNKFVDHLPLYRQEQMFWREGVWLSRSTLCDWLAGCARVLQPLFVLMWQQVFASRDLHTDDTPVCVQGQASKGHLWVYFGDSAHPYTVYDFTVGRGQDRPVQCLSAFAGYLHADGYTGYDKLFGDQRIEVGCWAHARRYFYDARATDPVRACYVLGSIGRLYTLEAAAKYAFVAARLSELEYWDVREQLRERQARPLLESLGAYAKEERGKVLPRSPIGEAFTYLSNQWLALQHYVSHGFLDIDNNVAEQALRAIALGRKNWLFLGSEEGGKTAATLYSLAQTCKRHGLDPWFYLKEMLTILPTIPESARATEVPKWLPDRWAQQQSSSPGQRASPE